MADTDTPSSAPVIAEKVAPELVITDITQTVVESEEPKSEGKVEIRQSYPESEPTPLENVKSAENLQETELSSTQDLTKSESLQFLEQARSAEDATEDLGSDETSKPVENCNIEDTPKLAEQVPTIKLQPREAESTEELKPIKDVDTGKNNVTMAESLEQAKATVAGIAEKVQGAVATGTEQEKPGEPSKSALKRAEKEAKKAAEKAAKAAKQAALPVVGGKKQDDIIGITVSKAENFSQWYQEVVLKSEMIEYYTEISGFFVMRPATMYIWNVIRKWFTEKIEGMGVDEANFPMFLSAKALEKEKDHVEGFAPELAWVTKAGDKNLEVPVAVRPTSEALMYPYYAKWIRSHRDLPLRLNQWNSVVRWEAKQTTPFLRAREFLWQEGHTAHLTEELAGKEVLEILELYAGVYEQLLAVPVVRGKKTENEKFAGGYYTTTVEGYIPSNGRGIQGATSHCLGQNFSKMFDITVQDPNVKDKHLYVWQNSWGLSTRVIGVMVMIHGDDKGLVLPPRIAKIQSIIIPLGITKTTSEETKKSHGEKLQEIKATLKKAGVRAEDDLREGYTPPWKFNDWELKGVPLRIEFGPKDAEKQVISYARRDTGEKGTIPITDISIKVPELLETIQSDMYKKAEKAFDEHRIVVDDWEKVIPALDDRNVVMIPFCLEPKCEDKIKELTTREHDESPDASVPQAPSMGMKSLCIPFNQPKEVAEGTKCLNPECQTPAKQYVMFGRSY